MRSGFSQKNQDVRSYRPDTHLDHDLVQNIHSVALGGREPARHAGTGGQLKETECLMSEVTRLEPRL